jgi:hypothetical protein
MRVFSANCEAVLSRATKVFTPTLLVGAELDGVDFVPAGNDVGG